jgi:hypothetical protein
MALMHAGGCRQESAGLDLPSPSYSSYSIVEKSDSLLLYKKGRIRVYNSDGYIQLKEMTMADRIDRLGNHTTGIDTNYCYQIHGGPVKRVEDSLYAKLELIHTNKCTTVDSFLHLRFMVDSTNALICEDGRVFSQADEPSLTTP